MNLNATQNTIVQRANEHDYHVQGFSDNCYIQKYYQRDLFDVTSKRIFIEWK